MILQILKNALIDLVQQSQEDCNVSNVDDLPNDAHTDVKPKTIRLFQFTDRGTAQAILDGGFRDGEDGVVRFSRYCDSMGESSRAALLEVQIAITEEELEAKGQPVDENEVWDDSVGDFVPVSDRTEVQSFVWYRIPAANVNANGAVRLISGHERKLIVEFDEL